VGEEPGVLVATRSRPLPDCPACRDARPKLGLRRLAATTILLPF